MACMTAHLQNKCYGFRCYVTWGFFGIWVHDERLLTVSLSAGFKAHHIEHQPSLQLD